MGKSTKTSSSKVDAAVVDAAPTKHWKKGKREAEDDIEKPLVSAKKQKLEEKKTEVVKKVKQSSSDDDSSSESEQPKVKASAKNGGLVAFTNKKVESSSDSSSSDDNVTAVKKVPATQTKKPVPATQKKVESSDEYSSEEETSSDDNVTEAKKIPVVASQKKVSSSSDGSSSDEETSSDDNVSAPKKVPSANVAVTQNKVESSSDSDDETSSDDNVTAAKKVPEATKRKAESSSDNSDSEDETDSGDNVTTGKKVPAVADIKKKGESSSDETESDSDSEDETSKKSNAKVQTKGKADAEEESEEDNSEGSDDDPQKKKLKPSGTINVVKTSLKVDAEESSFEEESTDDDKPSKMQGVTKEKPSITPNKKDTEVKMTNVEKTKMKARKNGSPFENTPKTSTNPKRQTGSKTMFVANLSYSVEQLDVDKIFKVAGKVIDIHFGMNVDLSFDAIEPGEISPTFLLEQLESQICKVKDEAFSRKEILGNVQKWLAACKEDLGLIAAQNLGPVEEETYVVLIEREMDESFKMVLVPLVYTVRPILNLVERYFENVLISLIWFWDPGGKNCDIGVCHHLLDSRESKYFLVTEDWKLELITIQVIIIWDPGGASIKCRHIASSKLGNSERAKALRTRLC